MKNRRSNGTEHSTACLKMSIAKFWPDTKLKFLYSALESVFFSFNCNLLSWNLLLKNVVGIITCRSTIIPFFVTYLDNVRFPHQSHFMRGWLMSVSGVIIVM